MSLLKVVKLLSQLTGNYQLSSSFSVKVGIYQGFVSTFVYHGNGCSDRRYEGWFINGVVV